MAKRTLLVSGSFADRMLLRDALASIGCHVVGEAKSVQEAVEKYKNIEPDLVVIDVNLSDADGLIAVRRIISVDPHASILMCAGNGQRALAMEALGAGATDFIVKPINPRKLMKAVQMISKRAA